MKNHPTAANTTTAITASANPTFMKERGGAADMPEAACTALCRAELADPVEPSGPADAISSASSVAGRCASPKHAGNGD